MALACQILLIWPLLGICLDRIFGGRTVSMGRFRVISFQESGAQSHKRAAAGAMPPGMDSARVRTEPLARTDRRSGGSALTVQFGRTARPQICTRCASPCKFHL